MINNRLPVESCPPTDLLRRLIQLGHLLGFDFPENFGTEECRSALLQSPRSHVAIRFDIRDDTNRLDVLAGIRTTSWEYDGERTDVHDVNAISFALLVWLKLGLTSSFFYERGYASKSEMYCVMLTFTQPYPSGLTLDAEGIQRAGELLILACQSGDTFAVCANPAHAHSQGRRDDTGYSYEAAEPWAQKIVTSLGQNRDDADFTCSRRLCPNWAYFFLHRKGLAVLHAPQFVETWRGSIAGRRPDVIEGLRGRLLLDGQSRHFVSYGVMERAAQVLRALGENARGRDLPCVAFDNRVLFLGTEHLVAVFRECGRPEFEMERERVRGRYEFESQLLFPTTMFSWAPSIPDDSFEAMVCELLELEPNVIRVRRAGVTRERDAGRDLLADWVVPPTNTKAVDESAPPLPVRVVVQCKASMSTVGKGKVQDIRDIVDFHEAAGFFLAVSSQLSGPLIAHLERLRQHQHWHIDWWTRLEIEQRLRRHPDVLARYPGIVQPR